MRSEKVVQGELDAAKAEFKNAVDRGDIKEQEKLNEKICELKTEFEWIML